MPGGTKPLVYVSYAWSSRATDGAVTDTGEDQDREAIVDELCAVLAHEEQITVGRDKKLVRTGDSIVDFAADIASSGLILAVISHRSLRSDWCMVHELLQAFRRRNFDAEAFGADVLALVLEDALEDFKDQSGLVAYWAARHEAKFKTMKLADPGREGSPKSWEDVDALRELCKRLPDLIRALGIRCMPRTADAIRKNDFRDTRDLVLRRLEERGHLERGLADLPRSVAPPPPDRTVLWRIRCRLWRETLSDGVEIPMAWIPADPTGQPGDFLLGRDPITLRQWQVVAGWPPLTEELRPDPTEHHALDQSVTGISHGEALEFCRRLAARTGRYYELPSEEQWEHACRAGTTTPYSWGRVWSPSLAAEAANPWGLRQMHGGLWEWCRGGVLQGGSWVEPYERRQPSSRAEAIESLHPSAVGLRVCCLPFGTPALQLDASRSQWRPPITRAACEQVLGQSLTDSAFDDLEHGLRRFRIVAAPGLFLFLSLLADVLAGGADDPGHPLRLREPAAVDRFAQAMAGFTMANESKEGITRAPFSAAAFLWDDRALRELADQTGTAEAFWAALDLPRDARRDAFLSAWRRAVRAFPGGAGGLQ